jgi:hypothetical protein
MHRLDLQETVRPMVDRWVLMFVKNRTFTRHDFVETVAGSCRIAPGLAQSLAATGPLWFHTVASHVEKVAATIGATSKYSVRVSTPLTASNKRAAQNKRPWSVPSDAMMCATMPL